jgi:Protein of unknown function (DUF3098)
MSKAAKPIRPTTPTTPRTGTSSAAAPMTRSVREDSEGFFGKKNDTLIFGRENYRWMAIGFGLVMAGMFCMMGGGQPDPNAWDESIIYSPRIMIIAPILILAGLVVEVYAIFLKTKEN